MDTTHDLHTLCIMNEKRKFQRFDVNVPVSIEFLSGERRRRKKFFFETDNLSAQGAFLKSDNTLPEGAQIKVKMFLHFVEPVTGVIPKGLAIIYVTGHVLRACAGGTAICFNDDYEISFYNHLMQKEDVACAEKSMSMRLN